MMTRTSTFRTLIALVAALALLAACGGDEASVSSSDTSGSDAPEDTAAEEPVEEEPAETAAGAGLDAAEESPCSAVDQGTIDGALGGSFPGTEIELGVGVSCQYSDGTDSYIVTYGSSFGDSIVEDFEFRQSEGMEVTELAGLGDFAFQNSDGLWVKAGDGFMTIESGGGQKEALATAVAAELGL